MESLYDEFIAVTNTTMDSHIPSRVVTKKNLSPWINKKVKRMHKKKQRAYNRYRKSDTKENLKNFQDLRKTTQKETRRSYRKYINSICMDSSKKFWSYVKCLRQDAMGIPTLKKNGVFESDNTVKATILNDHFKSVFTQEDDILPQLPPTSFPPIPNITVSVSGVTKLLSDLNPHKATGPDGIPARILKVAAEEIAPALSIIFQKSLETGEIPSSWLRANVSPIFKKGNRTDASNYRPVSLTAITSKVLEHIIHSHIMYHFDSHSILSDKQHGFRSKHSCESQLIMTVNDLALSLDNRSQTDMIIMDFSKAFDSVPHNRLLLKLNHFGIQNNLLVWISNFLKHREQRVVVGGEHSAWTDVTSGVPQGTVLGPLLFLAYINDLPSNISSNVRLFADDCVIYRQIVNDYDHISLQEDLNTLEKWQRDWQMKFNAKKCFTMRITHNRNPKIFNYKLGECILETTNSHPYLGVCITSNLSWSTHINNITSSANRSLGFIRRNLYSCSKPIKQTAYMALVRPLLEYSNTVWDPNQKELINKIEMIQKRAARFTTNTYNRTTSITALIKDLEWDTLQNRRTANRLTVLHKARQGLLALPVDQLLQPALRQSRHNHPDSYQIITCKKDVYKYSYLPKTVIDWNKLPHSIIKIKDSPSFKEAVLNHLKQD